MFKALFFKRIQQTARVKKTQKTWLISWKIIIKSLCGQLSVGIKTAHQTSVCVMYPCVVGLHNLCFTCATAHQPARVHYSPSNMQWHEIYIFHVKCIFCLSVGQRRIECPQSPAVLNTDAARPSTQSWTHYIVIKKSSLVHIYCAVLQGERQARRVCELQHGAEIDFVWEVWNFWKDKWSVERVSLTICSMENACSVFLKMIKYN